MGIVDEATKYYRAKQRLAAAKARAPKISTLDEGEWLSKILFNEGEWLSKILFNEIEEYKRMAIGNIQSGLQPLGPQGAAQNTAQGLSSYQQMAGQLMGGPGGAGILGIGSAQQAQTSPPPSLAEKIKRSRERMAAMTKVLEYVEAQTNMELFKDDPIAHGLWTQALESIHKQLAGQL